MKIKNMRSFTVFLIAFVAGMALMKFFQEQRNSTTDSEEMLGKVQQEILVTEKVLEGWENNATFSPAENSTHSTKDISDWTDEKWVIAYLKEHQKLPDFYLTKSKARQKGWQANQGNLCEVLPGHAIGGDYFNNREGKLPKKGGRKYFEADVNYNCGRRNADRIVYSNDGLIYLTKDHYKTFQKQ